MDVGEDLAAADSAVVSSSGAGVTANDEDTVDIYDSKFDEAGSAEYLNNSDFKDDGLYNIAFSRETPAAELQAGLYDDSMLMDDMLMGVNTKSDVDADGTSELVSGENTSNTSEKTPNIAKDTAQTVLDSHFEQSSETASPGKKCDGLAARLLAISESKPSSTRRETQSKKDLDSVSPNTVVPHTDPTLRKKQQKAANIAKSRPRKKLQNVLTRMQG